MKLLPLLLLLFTSNAFALTWEVSGAESGFLVTTEDSVEKTSGSTLTSAAQSLEGVASGDLFVEYEVLQADPNDRLNVGISSNAISPTGGREAISFAVYCIVGNKMEVFELGVRLGAGIGSGCNVGTKFKVAVESAVLNVYSDIDGVSGYSLVYTSVNAVTYPLYASVAIQSSIVKVGLVENLIPPPPPGSFLPFDPINNPPQDSIATKGGLLTSDGTTQKVFLPCADNEVLIYDDTQTLGLKCGAN